MLNIAACAVLNIHVHLWERKYSVALPRQNLYAIKLFVVCRGVHYLNGETTIQSLCGILSLPLFLNLSPHRRGLQNSTQAARPAIGETLPQFPADIEGSVGGGRSPRSLRRNGPTPGTSGTQHGHSFLHVRSRRQSRPEEKSSQVGVCLNLPIHSIMEPSTT